MKNYNGAYGEN